LKYLLNTILFLFYSILLYAQNKNKQTPLQLHYTSTVDTKTQKKLPKHLLFSDSLETEKIKLDVLNMLHQQGYLAASLDSINSDSLLSELFFSPNQRYKIAFLKNHNVTEEAINKAGFKEKILLDKPFQSKQIQRLFEDVVSYYENNGYPFASVYLDSVNIKNHTIAGKINVNKGNLYFVDSLIVKGNARISKRYLENYLGIKEGNLYNESQIKRISNRIKELPFLTEKQPYAIEFSEKFSSIYLYIDKKKASRFNGVLGVQPDANGKVSLSGDTRLQLFNSFGRGELIDLNWRRIHAGTQDLKTKVNYPFLFNTPFGTEFDFRLYKRDTSFLEVNSNLALKYLMIGNNFIKVFVSNKSSSVLSKSFVSAEIPGLGNVKLLSYGLGVNVEKLDYRYNPTQGYRFSGNASVGNKKIIKTSTTPENAYQTLVLKSILYQIDFNGEVFILLSKRNVIKLGNQSARIFNNTLFENELFRIGGLLTFRGFDEESIFASYYTVSTIEYRFILEQNSYFHLFSDLAYYEKDTYRSFDNDIPYSIGTGISFETKAGIFSLSYALGSEKGNPFLLRSAKVHFGFVNYF